jgi:hypothetical protein
MAPGQHAKVIDAADVVWVRVGDQRRALAGDLRAERLEAELGAAVDQNILDRTRPKALARVRVSRRSLDWQQ